LDSTAIACAVARLRNGSADDQAAPLLAFSYQAKEYDESPYIDNTVQQTGVELVAFRPEPSELWEKLERVLWYQDEPLHSMVAVITFELSRLAAARGVKVILNGGGPDESLGYPSLFPDYWRTLVSSGRISHAWREIREYHRVHGGRASAVLAGVVANQWKAPVRRLPGGSRLVEWRRERKLRKSTWFTTELTSQLAADGMPAAEDTVDSILRRAVEVAPLPYYLRIEDRNSMAHSVEARMPFLDHRLVSLAFALPAEWKVRGALNKYVLRAAMRDRIPEVVRARPDKMGFPIPLRAWFADAFYDSMQDVLGSREVSERGIYRPNAIRRDLERHKNGEVDVSGQLFEVLEFEVWSRLLRNHAEACTAAVP
jgi:asparagine synthase (glutamine-hydrolysing)